MSFSGPYDPLSGSDGKQRLVLHLSDREAMDCLLTELVLKTSLPDRTDEESGLGLLDPEAAREPETPQRRSVRIEDNGIYRTPIRSQVSPGIEDVPTGTTVVNNDVGRQGEDGFAA